MQLWRQMALYSYLQLFPEDDEVEDGGGHTVTRRFQPRFSLFEVSDMI